MSYTLIQGNDYGAMVIVFHMNIFVNCSLYDCICICVLYRERPR